MSLVKMNNLTCPALVLAMGVALPLQAWGEASKPPGKNPAGTKVETRRTTVLAGAKRGVATGVDELDRLNQLTKVGAEEEGLGNERGNGGDALIQRNGTVRFLDLVREPRAEILDPEIEGLTEALTREMQKHRGLTGATFIPAGVDEKAMTISQAIRRALGRLTFYLVPGPLPEVHDRGVVVLPWNIKGQIVRLALQDRENRSVVVDRRFYNLLPARDRVAFLMHEALIRLWNDDFHNEPLASTERIANFVHILFNRTGNMPEGMPEKIAVRYLCDAGYLVSEKPIHTWKKMSGTLAPGSPYFPTQNAIVFRQSEKCYTAILRLDGPAQGVHDPHVVRPYFGMHKYVFKEINEQGEEFSAGIGLLLGRNGTEEFWFESRNPDTPMIFGANYRIFTMLRVNVLGY